MIDAELIARARDFDIVSTAESLGASLKRATATEWVGPCPKCGGRDRFAVNVKRRVWHCRGCAKGSTWMARPPMVRTCPFLIIAIASKPASVRRVVPALSKPSPGRTRRLMRL